MKTVTMKTYGRTSKYSLGFGEIIFAQLLYFGSSKTQHKPHIIFTCVSGALHRKRTRSIVSARARKNKKYFTLWSLENLSFGGDVTDRKKYPTCTLCCVHRLLFFLCTRGYTRVSGEKIKREKTLPEHPVRKTVYGCSSTQDSSSPFVWAQSRRVYCPKRVVILLLLLP